MDPTQGALRNPTAAPTPVTPTSQTHDPGQGGSAHSCATRRRSGARRWGKELMATQVYGTVRWPHVTDSYGAIHRKDTKQDAATENDSRKCRLCRGTCGHPLWNSNPPEQGEEMAWLTAQNGGTGEADAIQVDGWGEKKGNDGDKASGQQPPQRGVPTELPLQTHRKPTPQGQKRRESSHEVIGSRLPRPSAVS